MRVVKGSSSAIVLALLASCNFPDGAEEINAHQKRFLRIKAPRIQTTTLSGERWSLAEQRGHVVILYFWASWCSQCKGEAEAIRDIAERVGNRDDLVIVGVALDEAESVVREVLGKGAMPGVQLFEPGAGFRNSVARAYGVIGLPQTEVVTKVGTGARFRATRGGALAFVQDLLYTSEEDYLAAGESIYPLPDIALQPMVHGSVRSKMKQKLGRRDPS